MASLEGAGPLANDGHRGVYLHAGLITTPDGLPLGVTDFNYVTRSDKERGKKPRGNSVPIEKKESFRWLQGYRDACEIQAQFPGVEVISLADREADIFELFQEYEVRKVSGRSAAHLVVRAK